MPPISRPAPKGEYNELEWRVAAKIKGGSADDTVGKRMDRKARETLGDMQGKPRFPPRRPTPPGTPKPKPMRDMPRRPKTPGMTRMNRGPF